MEENQHGNVKCIHCGKPTPAGVAPGISGAVPATEDPNPSSVVCVHCGLTTPCGPDNIIP